MVEDDDELRTHPILWVGIVIVVALIILWYLAGIGARNETADRNQRDVEFNLRSDDAQRIDRSHIRPWMVAMVREMVVGHWARIRQPCHPRIYVGQSWVNDREHQSTTAFGYPLRVGWNGGLNDPPQLHAPMALRQAGSCVL